MRLKSKTFIGLGLAVLVLTLLYHPAPVHADGPISSEYFGLDEGGYMTESANNITLAKSMGAGLVRFSIYWRYIEPTNTTPDKYDWSFYDVRLARLHDQGVTPIVFVAENPSWAATTPCGPVDTTNPDMLAEWSQFMGALAGRYPYVKIWMLYNEADHSRGASGHTGGCFGEDTTEDVNNNGVPDYAEYAEMAAAARTAMRAANPNTAVSFAVAFDDFDKVTCPPSYPGSCPPASHFNYYFLPKLFGYIASHPRPDGEPYADYLAFTYYDIYGPYWERQRWIPGVYDKRGIQAKAAALRQVMAQAGVSYPLLVAETGESSDSAWIGTDGQSQCVVRNMVRGIAANLNSVTWWTFIDYPVKQWYYGVVDGSYAPKPAYTAYQTLTANLTGATLVKAKNAKFAEAYTFDKDGKTLVVAWSADARSDGKAPCSYPRSSLPINFQAASLGVSDMYGNTMTITDNDENDLNPRVGKIRLRIDGFPRYFTLNPQ